MASLYVPLGGPSCTVHTTDLKFLLFILWDFCEVGSSFNLDEHYIFSVKCCLNRTKKRLRLAHLAYLSLPMTPELFQTITKCLFTLFWSSFTTWPSQHNLFEFNRRRSKVANRCFISPKLNERKFPDVMLWCCNVML